MKTVINVILGVCALVLAYICIGSIMDDQALDARIDARKDEVISRLKDIRECQEAFKEMHDTVVNYTDPETEEMLTATMGRYALSFDELEDFLKNGRYSEETVKKGQIQEALQRKGWTDKKVADLIYELRKQGQSDDQIRTRLDQEELFGVWVDTVWAKSPIDAISKKVGHEINVDSLRYIPFSDQCALAPKADGKPQLMEWEFAERIEFKMDIPMHHVMECAAPFKTFLSGMGKLCNRKIVNMTQFEEGRGAYPGLKIGEIAKDSWNNNAGSWE